jgi:hypothetical protein
MPRTASILGLFAALLSLSLPACEGEGAPGGPFSPSEFSTASGDTAASLSSTCAEYCSHQDACGTADASCSDDCVHGDVAQHYAVEPEADPITEEPVPEACADAYVGAIDCLATPACEDMEVACEAEVSAYVDCKVEALAS